MKTVRRIYLYLVSAISLTAVVWAIILLARLVLTEQIGQGQITELASLLAVIIVGLPIFLFHWLIAQRLAAGDQEERGGTIRRLFFGVMMGLGAVPVIANVYRLVDNTLLALLGSTPKDYYPYDLTTGEHLAAIIAWSVVWLYIGQQIRTDNRILPPREDYLGIRRIYLFIFSQTGLVMTAWGAVSLLQTLMETAATGLNWETAVANAGAQLLVGCVVWIAHWLPLQSGFLSGDPSEERSILRKIYLYLNIFVFLVMTVTSASGLLKRLIELALGAPPAEEPLLSQLSGPVPLLIVGGLFWAYHWTVLRQDARQAPEGPRQATVRRIYAYLVAAIGLGVLLGGLGGLLSLLIDMLTTPAEIGLAFYREEVAIFTAMIVVGIPVWLLPWRRSQNLALTTGGDSRQAAIEERRSTTRKIYLYVYLLAAMLAIFGSAGWFVYHILTALLGADLPTDFITLVLDALIITLLAVGVGVYHWLAIRQDGQLEEANEAQRLAEVSVVVIDDNAGQLGQKIIKQLQYALAGIQIKPIGLTPDANRAMGGEVGSDSSLENKDAVQNVSDLRNAKAIIGSWQALTASQVAAEVEASPALKLVIPSAEQNWRWVGMDRKSPDFYAQQAVEGVKQIIEGEEVSFSQDTNPAIIVLMVLGGLFAVQIIFVGLMALVGNVL